VNGPHHAVRHCHTLPHCNTFAHDFSSQIPFLTICHHFSRQTPLLLYLDTLLKNHSIGANHIIRYGQLRCVDRRLLVCFSTMVAIRTPCCHSAAVLLQELIHSLYFGSKSRSRGKGSLGKVPGPPPLLFVVGRAKLWHFSELVSKLLCSAYASYCFENEGLLTEQALLLSKGFWQTLLLYACCFTEKAGYYKLKLAAFTEHRGCHRLSLFMSFASRTAAKLGPCCQPCFTVTDLLLLSASHIATS